MLESLTWDDFNPLVESEFTADLAEDATVSLRLVRAARVMESEAARLPRHPFSLFFRGPGQPFLPQRIYRLHHERFDAPPGRLPRAGGTRG